MEFYTQCPNVLIFGLPELSGNDRMTLLCLISLVWGVEGPHQLSIREVSRFVHISAAALCDSAKGETEKQRQREQGKFREGILSRLIGHGYISIEEKDGHTYFTVHLAKIWEDNATLKKQTGVYNLNTINKQRQNGVYNLNAPAYNPNSQTPSHVENLNVPVENSDTLNERISLTGSSNEPIKTKKTHKEDNRRRSDPFPDFCEEKIRDLAHEWDRGNKDQHLADARDIWEQSNADEDTYWNMIFKAIGDMQAKRPPANEWMTRVMQCLRKRLVR